MVHHAGHEAVVKGYAGAGSSAATLPWQAGVDVFFVISGFVMVYASRRLFGEPGAARVFLAHRVARIVPLYWLATTLYLAVFAFRPELLRSASANPLEIAASFLFVPFTRPDGLIQPVYSLGWTLNYEMFFYVLFALGLGLDRRRAVLAVSAALAVVVGGGLAFGPLPQPLRFWTDPIVLEFMLGMWLGALATEGYGLGRPARLALAVLALVLLLLSAGVRDLDSWDRFLRFGLPAALLAAAGGLTNRRPSGPPSMPVRVAAALGDASYAMYLLHPFLIRGGSRALDALGLGASEASFVACALAATAAVSVPVYRWGERPVTIALRRLLEPRTARLEQAGPARPRSTCAAPPLARPRRRGRRSA